MAQNAAVIIGINYDAGGARPGLPPVRYAEADARAVAALLEPAGYAVALLIGAAATREAIARAANPVAIRRQWCYDRDALGLRLRRRDRRRRADAARPWETRLMPAIAAGRGLRLGSAHAACRMMVSRKGQKQ